MMMVNRILSPKVILPTTLVVLATLGCSDATPTERRSSFAGESGALAGKTGGVRPTAEIAFLASVGGSGATRVALINADGSNQVTVSNSSGGYPPSWSGSGSGTSQSPWRLVYNTSMSSFTTVNVDTTGGTVNLKSARSFSLDSVTLDPRWMPGKDSIAYGTEHSLMIVGATGGTPAVLYQPADGTRHVIYSSWKTDGSAIAFVEYSTTAPANFAIRILNRQTGAVTTAVTPGSLDDIFQLDWARTRDEIAFTVHPANQANRETWVVSLTPDVDGNLQASAPPRRLTATAGWPSWSPNDKQVVIAGLHLVDYATGVVGPLFSNGGAADWRR